MVYTVVNTGSSRERDDDDVPSSPKPRGGGGQQTKSGVGFWNLDLELQAIKTILTPSSEWSTKVFSVCKVDYFHHSTTKSIFSRVSELMASSNTYELPTLDFVLSDSKISSAIRQTIRDTMEGDSSIAIVKSQGDYDILIQGLISLSKTRALYQATHKAANELLDSNEPTDLIKQVSDQLGQSLFNMEGDEELLSQINMGWGYNQAAEDSFTRIVNGVFEQVKIKTGFQEFDERTGGFYKTNLVILGANSGGGKSLMAVNLLIRQYLLGYNTILCSYEMTDDEVMVRLLANIGEVDMNKLQNNRLTPPETRQVTAAWREFNLKGYLNKNTYSIICPKTETTVPEIGFRVRSQKPDVLILDYINLLGSSSGTAEAQWQQLGDISREAKLLANKLNCVVILLAQIDDTYNLRYSKAIKDHANFVMGWIRSDPEGDVSDASSDSRSIEIHQMKARNAPIYKWTLGERFDIAQFRDPGQQDRTNWPTADELMMLELQCQSLGLKLEPTVSKEFDTKKRLEAKQLVNSNTMTEEAKEADVDTTTQVDEVPVKTNLLFSAEDAMSIDFSKLEVKTSSASLIRDNLFYEDTV